MLAEHGGAGSGLFSGLNSIHGISITKASSAAGRRDLGAWPGKHWRKWIHWSDLPLPPSLHPLTLNSLLYFLLFPYKASSGRCLSRTWTIDCILFVMLIKWPRRRIQRAVISTSKACIQLPSEQTSKCHQEPSLLVDNIIRWYFLSSQSGAFYCQPSLNPHRLTLCPRL